MGGGLKVVSSTESALAHLYRASASRGLVLSRVAARVRVAKVDYIRLRRETSLLDDVMLAFGDSLLREPTPEEAAASSRWVSADDLEIVERMRTHQAEALHRGEAVVGEQTKSTGEPSETGRS